MKNVLVVICVILTITGCATNPVTGKTELSLVSQDAEVNIGQEQFVPTQQSQGGQYVVDETLTAYVASVGKKLAAVSDRELPYEFVVLNSSVPNAWALPGGKIAVNRGLLTALENEAELAAVLGHEIVHSAARHGAKAIERNMLYQGALLLTSAAVADSAYSNYIIGGAQLGAQLLTQGYSRSAELEADRIGMEYMARAGYDPRGAVSLQEKFLAFAHGKQTGWVEGLFASHPPSGERLQLNIENVPQIESAKANTDWTLGASTYRNTMAYLHSRADAYRAYDQAVALRRDEPKTALGRVDYAISLEPSEPTFYGLKADILSDQGRHRDAIASYNQALAIHDGYYQYFLGRGLSYAKLGEATRARTDLEHSNQLVPTAVAMNELGTLSLVAGDHLAAKKYFASVMSTQGPLAASAQQSFLQLDVFDNPQSYFVVMSKFEGEAFTTVVTNQSGVDVKSIDVAFTATINGQRLQVTRTVGPLDGHQQIKTTPGWKIGATDTIEAVSVQVVGAR